MKAGEDRVGGLAAVTYECIPDSFTGGHLMFFHEGVVGAYNVHGHLQHKR